MLIVVSIFSTVGVAQNNTNSPYTRFGFGELSDPMPGDQKAMGGVSLGIRNPITINTQNPASYSAVDSMTFMFDLGVGGLLSRFTDNTGSSTNFNSNIEYITMQFPLSKNMGFSAGVLPYSFSGYSFYDEDSVQIITNQSTETYANYSRLYYGAGGISQVYAGLAYKFLNRFSIGANAYYMFGKSTNVRNLSFLNTSYTSTTQANTIDVKSFRMRYGFQYFETFNKKHSFTLGAILENQTQMNGSFYQTIYGNPTDTINYDNQFDFPMTWGAGLSYQFENKLTVGADFSTQAWADARFFGKTDSLQNRNKFSLGAEYIPNQRSNKYLNHVKYRVGFNFSNPYYKVNGINPAPNYGISFGLGFPLRQSKTVVNTTFEYGKVGTSTMFREDYLKFSVNATFNETWFFKRKL